MDLNLNALIGATSLVPISITLRRVYAPSFEMPAAFASTIARLDACLSAGPAGREAQRRFAATGAPAF